VSSDFELEDIENLQSTENSQTTRQRQPVQDFQSCKSPQSSPLNLDKPPVASQLSTSFTYSNHPEDYRASSYSTSTASSHPVSLNDTSISQHSNYTGGPMEQATSARENLHYPPLVPPMFVFPVSRPPVLAISPSDVRAAQASNFMY